MRRAYTDLSASIEKSLEEAGVPFSGQKPPIGTPRRLIVCISDVAARQPDQTKESRGPALGSAFGEDGSPSKALEGFCRGQGVDVAEVEKRDGYVWVNKTIPGKPTLELLAEVLPQAIKSLTFDKTMRWGSGRMRFARPIRWILASFGGELVSFDVEGVPSGLQSYGHRFYAPEPFEAKSFDSLLDGLMARKVEPDPKEREKTVRDISTIVASGVPDLPAALVDENVFLTEWPTPIEGAFKSEYLALPEPVLVTAMAKHEKMFPVRDGAGRITNKFVFVRNSGEDETVRKGAEWVLNARFNDAKFFFDEDSKFTLEHFLERTKNVVFQEKLGTIRQRADRLSQLSEWIADQTEAPLAEAAFAKQAGLFAKADLTTGLVSELASLQGIVGGEYGKREGFPDPVCWAIASHYDPLKNEGKDCEGSRTAIRVLLADQIDKLAGYLGIGQVPSGSSDPMGLRRAATYCIESSWKRWDLDFAGLISVAVTLYARQDIDLDVEGAKKAAKDIFVGRYDALLDDHRHDVVDAAVMADYSWSALSPMQVAMRLGELAKIQDDTNFIQTASRPLNILKSARDKGEAFVEEKPLASLDRGKLNSREGEALADALALASPTVASLKSIAPAIHSYFESTMIMSADAEERKQRLTLVAATCQALLRLGDLTKLVIEGP